MPKMKRHKGLAKRVRLTATGKLRYKKSNTGHLMSHKDGSRCRRLRKDSMLNNPKLAAKARRALMA